MSKAYSSPLFVATALPALSAARVDPQLDGAKKHIDALTRDVNGQDI